MAPKVAVRLSRLSTIALTGSTTLPVNRKSSTRVAPPMIPAASGNFATTAASVSTSWALSPVTSTGYGAGAARTSRASRSPAAEYASAAETTDSHVPVGLANRSAAGTAGATCPPPA